MKNKMVVIGWTLAFAVILLMPCRAFSDSADLSVVSPATVSQGSSFKVDVNVSNITDLYDFQLDLTFDPAVVQAIGGTEGGFLQGGGTTFFLPGTIDNLGGSVTFNADSLIGLIPGVTGSGTLLEFDFSALAAGTSSLGLSNVILEDSQANGITNYLAGGSVTVTGSGPVPTPEPSSLILFVGAICSIALLAALKRVS